MLAADAAVVVTALGAAPAGVAAERVRCRHWPSPAFSYYWPQLAAGSKRSVSLAAAAAAAAAVPVAGESTRNASRTAAFGATMM